MLNWCPGAPVSMTLFLFMNYWVPQLYSTDNALKASIIPIFCITGSSVLHTIQNELKFICTSLPASPGKKIKCAPITGGKMHN